MQCMSCLEALSMYIIILPLKSMNHTIFSVDFILYNLQKLSLQNIFALSLFIPVTELSILI